jgi:cell division protein FtsB
MWVPWAATSSSADDVSDGSVSQEGYVSGAGSSLETWSPQFSTMSLDDQIAEIRDHVMRLRAEIATLKADLKEVPTRYYNDRG